jgi:hypothetical protein
LLSFLNQGRQNVGYVTDEFSISIAEETRRLDLRRWNEARGSDVVESELDAAQGRAQNVGIEGTLTLLVSGP